MAMISLGRGRTETVRAAVLGMSQEARDAGTQLDRHLESGPLTLLGSPGPHRALLDRARRHGALEGGPDDDSAPTRRVVIPMTGIGSRNRRRWERAGYSLIDLTLPSVRRLHAMKALLCAESRHLVVIGFRGDPECEALRGEGERVSVVENADEVARLPFAPRFGLVCQTGIAGRRFATVAAALRMRHPDSNVQAIDTRGPAMIRREAALEHLARTTEAIIILADPSDRSGLALYEAARCLGRSAVILGDAADPVPPYLTEMRRIGLAAGLHTPDKQVALLESRLCGF